MSPSEKQEPAPPGSSDAIHGESPEASNRRSIPRAVSVLINAVPQRNREFVLRGVAIFTGRRVPGLAAEAAFWAIFSLPWLSLALVSGLAWISQFFVADPLDDARIAAQKLADQVLTPEAASQYATPIINDLFSATRTDLGVVGLILAIWAGSRAVLTYIDAIMVINGEFGERGYLRRRTLSVLIYIIGALMCVVAIPLIFVGPQTVGDWLNLPSWAITVGYVVLSVVVGFLLLVFLFHYASKTKARLLNTWPGAAIAVGSCAVASVGLTIYMRRLFSESSVYGILATPIALMIFAYVMSLMVLIGAIYNALIAEREVFQAGYDAQGRFERSTQVVEQLASTEPGDAASERKP